MVDEETFEEDLSEEIGMVARAYCLYVDGERIGATPYAGALEELLAQLKAAATNEDTISCEFKENVEVKEEYVLTEELMNLGCPPWAACSRQTAVAEWVPAQTPGNSWPASPGRCGASGGGPAVPFSGPSRRIVPRSSVPERAPLSAGRRSVGVPPPL